MFVSCSDRFIIGIEKIWCDKADVKVQAFIDVIT